MSLLPPALLLLPLRRVPLVRLLPAGWCWCSGWHRLQLNYVHVVWVLTLLHTAAAIWGWRRQQRACTCSKRRAAQLLLVPSRLRRIKGCRQRRGRIARAAAHRTRPAAAPPLQQVRNSGVLVQPRCDGQPGIRAAFQCSAGRAWLSAVPFCRCGRCCCCCCAAPDEIDSQRELPQRGCCDVKRGVCNAQLLALRACNGWREWKQWREELAVKGWVCSLNAACPALERQARGSPCHTALTQSAIKDGLLVVAQRAHKYQRQVAHVACRR